jgi:sigma-54 dependent transcriptional regulator, acetoin dehydrogenase operon transcriptional activator AcoR
MSDIASIQHASRVRDVVKATLASGECPSMIMRSWTRCVNDYALDPGGVSSGMEAPKRELQHRLDTSERLLCNAKGEMSSLFQQLAQDDAVVVIADADGIVLETVGEAGYIKQVARIGMRPGGDWSERSAGTNGVGTCLAERRPVVVDRGEHFFPTLTRLSCAASPIFGDDGDLVGVLDVTSGSDLSQQHFRMLIGMSAQTIENRLFEAKYERLCMLHLHARRELVHTFHEGLLAIDEDGRVVAANQCALFQLGIARRQQIVGRDIREMFQLRLGELASRGDSCGGQPVPIKGICGRAFYAAVRIPGRTPVRSTVAMPWLPQEAGETKARSTAGFRARVWGDASIDTDFVRALRVYERDVYVMIAGETGCGKEILAKAMHEAGSRAKGPFVAINCAAVPENLIESELFGYRGGAFTGASREGRRGRILAADKGTLLLDEIGDMPLPLQARLLRVLEEREVTPLGGESSIKVDIRVICATHRDLREMVAAGTFRSDLYFRLAAFSVELPPLRARSGRVDLVRAVQADISPDIEIEPAALSLLESFPWPGNLRQLRNVLQTANALCEGDLIRCFDLPLEVRSHRPDAAVTESVVVPMAAHEFQVSPQIAEEAIQEVEGLSYLDRAERDALLLLLRKNRWNVTRVAAELGASRNTVYRKVNQYGLVRE